MHLKLHRHRYCWSTMAFLAISKLLLYLMCAFEPLHLAKGEVFTALAEMEELLETEAVLISNLQEYIKAQGERLDHLRA